MNELQIFNNPDFGEVRTLETNGKVLFCGSDVAKALGYSNPSKALNDHCRYLTKRYVPHPQSPDKTIEMSFIPESDLYRLVFSSKLPNAERFTDWVTEEVLPSIRKNGGYIAGQELTARKAERLSRGLTGFWIIMGRRLPSIRCLRSRFWSRRRLSGRRRTRRLMRGPHRHWLRCEGKSLPMATHC